MKQKSGLWTRAFCSITLINLLLMFGFEMLTTTIALYVTAVGGTATDVGLTMAIFTVAALVLRAAAGVLLDRYGRRPVFLLGLIAMAVTTAAYGFAAAVGLIAAVRLLHGMAWGAANTAASTVASDVIPHERFGEGMGWFALSSSIAMAIGPAVGLSVLNAAGFPALFGVGVGATVISFLIALTLPMKGGNKTEGKRPSALEPAALMPAAVMMFVCTTYGALIGFLAMFGIQLGIANSGIFFAVYAAALLVTRPFAGRITDRIGFSASVIPGLIITAAGLLVLGSSRGIAQFLVSAALYGIGIGAAQSGLQAMAVVLAPPHRKGAANATFFIGFDVGIGIGSVLAGAAAWLWGYGPMFMLFAAALIPALILFLAVEKRNRAA